MSLLMKALEKAAKDREEADTGRETAAVAGAAAPVAAAATTEFTLEPREPQLKSNPEPKLPEPAPMPVKPAAAAPPAPPSPELTLAATVIRAGGRETNGGLAAAVAFVREQPLLVFGPLVALALIGYGTYIYLNMTSPGVAVKPPPMQAAAPSTPIAPTPAPAAAPALAAGDSTAAAPKPPISIGALLTQAQAIAAGGKPAPKPAAVAAVPAPDPVTAVAAVAPAPTAVRDTIKVTTGGETPVINPMLARAYEVFSSGDMVLAPQLYNRVLQNEPNNIDALLALAAIATQQGDSNLASRHYVRVLEVEPRNALAQAGLIGMLGRADPLAAESRLKQLIAREPSAFLYFTLGNLYADQNRWPDAQQAYFQAHHLQAGNPDYAYNLAVGLEHVGQPKLALEYYRRALQLVPASGGANFSTDAVQGRIVTLEKTVR